MKNEKCKVQNGIRTKPRGTLIGEKSPLDCPINIVQGLAGSRLAARTLDEHALADLRSDL
jgi:hypothetical protein